MEQVEHDNLPLGIVINWCVAIPKAGAIPMIIINTNRYNVWARQPLLAAELYYAGFQPVPPQLIDTNNCQVEAGPIQLTSLEIVKPKFGPRPNTNFTDFDFKMQID